MMSTRETNGIPAPAVTIVAKGKGTKSGWKDDSVSFGFVQKLCNNENSTETLLGCIERNTYNLSEIFKQAKIGIGSRCKESNSRLGYKDRIQAPDTTIGFHDRTRKCDT